MDQQTHQQHQFYDPRLVNHPVETSVLDLLLQHYWEFEAICISCGQSIFQCPYCPHSGQGPVGGHGLEQNFVQCPESPHLKQASGGCLLVPLAGIFGLVWDI
jgi:hypothetical protein